MGWKRGPLPLDTYFWGGVVPVGEDSGGFYFADFCGDHVKLVTSEPRRNMVIQADQVAWYCNDLRLPPVAPKGGARLGDV